MGFSLSMYNFKKRYNSTKQPDGSTLATVYTNCILKENTNITAPTFLINDGVDRLPLGRYVAAKYDTGLTYYYWVTDFRSICTGIWEIDCKMDVLATWKEDIGNTVALVSRSSSEYDSSIVDDYYLFQNQYQTISTTYSNPVPIDIEGGYYVVSTRSQAVQNFNEVGTNAYILTKEQLQNLLQNIIFNDGDGTSGFGVYFGSNANAIASLHYIPLARAAWPGLRATDIYIDSFNLGSGMWFYQDVVPIFGSSVEIELRQATTDYSFEDFREHAPYKTYFLYMPYVGIVHLDEGKIGSATKIKVYGKYDVISGAIHYRIMGIRGTNETYISEYDSSVAMAMPINNTVNIEDRYIYNIVSAGMGAWNPFNFVDNIAKASSIITNSENIVAQTSGLSLTKVSATNNQLELIVVRQKGVMSDIEYSQTLNSQIGRPYYRVTAIKELSGYVRCVDAHVLGTGINVRPEIDSFLNEGFYYE